NEWRRHKSEMEPQGRKKDLTVSCDETKHETTSPEQDHSITSARSNSWAERRDKNVSAPSRRRRMSLDIPFYRTCPVDPSSGWQRCPVWEWTQHNRSLSKSAP